MLPAPILIFIVITWPSKKTTNLTKSNLGYDTSPAFSPKGQLAWLRMDEPGYEADKNDIIVKLNNKEYNLTKHWDGTVYSFKWSHDAKSIYFYRANRRHKTVI